MPLKHTRVQSPLFTTFKTQTGISALKCLIKLKTVMTKANCYLTGC